jgi:hypothetical protein
MASSGVVTLDKAAPEEPARTSLTTAPALSDVVELGAEGTLREEVATSFKSSVKWNKIRALHRARTEPAFINEQASVAGYLTVSESSLTNLKEQINIHLEHYREHQTRVAFAPGLWCVHLRLPKV